MFKIFQQAQEQEQETAATQMQERLLTLTEQFQEQIPLHLRMMLKGLLPQFKDSLTDELILEYIAKGRAYLDLIEFGKPLEGDSIEAVDYIS